MTQARIAKTLSAVALLVALGVGVAWAADLWGRLGITEAQAKTESVQALAGGNVPFYLAAKAVMAAAPAARATLVVEGLTWIKSFVGSAEFKNAYGTLRQERKPSPPAKKGTPDDQAKAQQEEQRKGLEESRKALALLPPDQRKEMEAVLKQMEAELKKSAADPKMQALNRELAAAGDKDEQDQYKTRLAEWENAYPAEPSTLVANRLRQFLDVCGDVDFAAKLTKADGKMRFADQKYQEKSSEWKLCFRAGRETLEATRGFAKTWLGELAKK
ncbi:MAG: hypothetical protein WCP29_13890 [Acidobacteriota bacterium]